MKKIGTYLTYIGAQKRAVARFCAPLALYKPRGTYLIPTCPHHNSKDTLISSAERSGAGKFWILAPLRCQENELQSENSNVFVFKSGLKYLPESEHPCVSHPARSIRENIRSKKRLKWPIRPENGLLRKNNEISSAIRYISSQMTSIRQLIRSEFY